MRPEISSIVLAVLPIALATVPFLKGPGLPLIGARNGLIPSLAFPALAGWLVKTFYRE